VTKSRALIALALLVGLAHLPFVASTLEDIDSVNFALGIRDFDVAQHRPHPPGYPVYIGIGKTMAAIVGALPGAGVASAIEARALSLISLLAALAAPVLLYRAFASLKAVRGGQLPWAALDPTALTATALTLAAPLTWTLAVRPMSDLPGLALALAAQACLLTAWWWQTPDDSGDRRLGPELMAASGRMIVLGGLIAGLAVGLRTQTLWLTAPLLTVVLFDRIGRGVAGAIMGAAMTFTIGALLWAVPLVVASGGLQGYLSALGSQAGEDFAGGEMLYVNPGVRPLAMALFHTFVSPWEWTGLAVVVLALAAAGALSLLIRDRRSLAAIIALFLPYMVFHLLFQDTSFTRYALPLVPAVAYLAAAGLAWLSPRALVPAGAALALAGIVAGTQTLIGYAQSPAPAVQAVRAINAAAATDRPGALAMHQTFQRPLEAELVGVSPQLPSPPRREWMELATYWNGGHEGAVWFLADPRRTDLALIDPRSRLDATQFRWGPSERPTFGGMRPAAVDWVRIGPPGWFVEEGWALTPETAGMARLMGRGPHLGPIIARVRRGAGARRLLVGGRNLAGPTDPAARFTIAVDGRPLESWDVAPGFFLRTIDVPEDALAGAGPFAALTIQSTATTGEAVIPTAVEQFDIQPTGTTMWGFDEGWHEAEYSPALGVWRWTSERAVIRLVGATGAVRVTVRFEAPLRYFESPSDITVTAGEAQLASAAISAETRFAFDVPFNAIVANDGRIALATTNVFVPAERGGAPDRRRLGLRVFELRVDPVSLR
jgi:hypothetical protein